MAQFLSLDELFGSHHFDREIIVLCVRWYLRFKLSFWDLVEVMAERGLSMAHAPTVRWVHHFAPEFERRWNRFARPVGASWRLDETYVKISGGRCLHRGPAYRTLVVSWAGLHRPESRVGSRVVCLATARSAGLGTGYERRIREQRRRLPRQ